jgi:hypothetical protein
LVVFSGHANGRALIMRHVLLIATLSMAVLTACGGSDSSSADESGGAEAVTAGGGGSFTVSGLGTNDTSFLTLKGNSLTFVNESGKGVQTGTPLPSSPAGFQAFGNFSPDGFLSAGEQIQVSTDLISKGSGKVVLVLAQSSTFDGTGHTSTQAELTRDHCLPQLRNLGPVDSTHPGKITKVSDTKYKWVLASPAGDFVYDVDVKASGLQCTFVSMPPVSCSAVVADAIATKARDDGSSSGEPFVNKLADGSYNGGIHDDESGEFRYAVTTNSSADHCKVTKITDTTKQ